MDVIMESNMDHYSVLDNFLVNMTGEQLNIWEELKKAAGVPAVFD